jgi:sigma-B regulation protein RsbU (phosphoserine phosphatase)
MLITSVAVSDFTWNEELANANAIQQHLLARESGVVAHADCSARCRQAHAVGGDFYDFLRLPDLRAEARRAPVELDQLIEGVNQQFHEASFEEGYATLFYATFDPETRILIYVNAGHNPPLVRRADGSVQWLQIGGAPVGLFQAWSYEEGSVQLNRGDVLVAYTDGIVEAQNACGDEWGARRLAGIVDEAGHETAAQINGRIWKAVDRFAGRAGQRDDMTSLVLRVV